jgi:phage gp36-like protein
MAEFTSLAEMESIWSTLGITLRLDDDDDGANDAAETALLDEVIADASDVCREYLQEIYEEDELSANRWVKRHCSWIACHLLSRRRGNPGQFTEEYDRAIEKFNLVRRGRLFVPGAAPRGNLGPRMANQIVDLRYFRKKLRTQTQTSVSPHYNDQDEDAYPRVIDAF